MTTYYARELLNYPIEELWDMLTGTFNLRFDNGVDIETNYRETLYSRYFWELINEYPEVPLNDYLHVSRHYKNGVLTAKTHSGMLHVLFVEILNNSLRENATPDKIEIITKHMYEIVNQVYNDLSIRLAGFVTSIDILDFLEIENHPSITEIMNKMEESLDKNMVSEAYDIITNVINKEPKLKNNALVKAVRSGMVNKNQALQCLGPRGVVTELDSKHFEIPVTRSFAQGMRNIYNLAVESRSGAKALYFSDSALKNAEFFARRLQLLTMSFERIEHADCSTSDYINWRVKPPEEKNGVEVYPGDLPFLLGKNYLDEETGELKTIDKDSTHLIGKMIKMRSPLKCKHPDKHTVCSVCFGEISKNISRFSNMGHICSANMTKQTTQSVLSTKHLDGSSTVDAISLDTTSIKFFRVSRDGTGYILRKEVNRDNLYLLVQQCEAQGIGDLELTDRVANISPSRVSSITNIVLVQDDDVGLSKIPITLNIHNRNAMFTTAFMEYIKKRGYSTDDDGNFIFYLDKWKKPLPIFKLPNMEFNYSAHGAEVARLIETRVNNMASKKDDRNPESVLTELFDLVNSKLFVNIAMLEGIIYAISIADPDSGNYDMARGYPEPLLSSGPNTIFNRSLSAAYAFKNLHNLVCFPSSFKKRKRPDHPLDIFVRPYEVLTKTKTEI
jgi:hypothetical protein